MKGMVMTVVVVALTVLLAVGCQERPDYDALRTEIRQLHTEAIAAHWNKDVEYFSHNLAEEYFSVNHGAIRQPGAAEIREQFGHYLDRTVFTEYRDLTEPLIGFSRDGSIAWSVVRVKVAGRQTGTDGTEQPLEFICAWITLYRRQDDRWVRLGDVSSFE